MPPRTTRRAPEFAGWTLEQAKKKLDAASTKAPLGRDGYRINRLFVEDKNHWQGGDTWVGPDGGGEAAVLKLVLERSGRQFTPVDVISECVDRKTNALLKTEAAVAFTPRQDPATEEAEETAKREAKEMVEFLSAWWDRVKFWERTREAVSRSSWAMRGPLRLWIAPENLADGPNGTRALPKVESVEDALARIELEAPEPANCIVYAEPRSMRRAGVYRWKDEQDQEHAEVWYLEGEGENTGAVVRVLKPGGDATEYRIPGLSRLPIAEMEAKLLITEPVRRQQNRLNFFESLLTRTGETAGFPERYTINARPHGIWMGTPPSNGPPLQIQYDQDNKPWYLHPAPRTLGASITTDLYGLEFESATQAGLQRNITTPGVVFRDPTDPVFVTRAADHARKVLLHQCKQGHLANDSTAEASGLAYQQSRADFEADLTNTKGPAEGLIRDIIEAAVAYAAAMGAQQAQGFLERFRCVVNLHVDAGPVSAEQQEQNNRNYQQGTLSRATAMARNGVEDVGAELEAIEQERGGSVGMLKERAAVLRELTSAGVAIGPAAIAAGFDPETAELLQQTDIPDPVRQ